MRVKSYFCAYRLPPELGARLGAAGCGGSPEELYERGQASFKKDKLEPATADLESFVAKSCGPTGQHAHCRQAHKGFSAQRRLTRWGFSPSQRREASGENSPGAARRVRGVLSRMEHL